VLGDATDASGGKQSEDAPIKAQDGGGVEAARPGLAESKMWLVEWGDYWAKERESPGSWACFFFFFASFVEIKITTASKDESCLPVSCFQINLFSKIFLFISF
jgi:hypothetical protein